MIELAAECDCLLDTKSTMLTVSRPIFRMLSHLGRVKDSRPVTGQKFLYLGTLRISTTVDLLFHEAVGSAIGRAEQAEALFAALRRDASWLAPSKFGLAIRRAGCSVFADAAFSDPDPYGGNQ